jgi:sporulation protein YhbH
MDTPRFNLSQDDWSLHRKGQQDQARHQEKVKEAIRQNLPDLISEEGLIMTDGKNILKIPIRSLEEYHFRYNFDKRGHEGQGQGGSKVGDVLGKDKGKPGDAASGAGDRPGLDYYEVGVSIDEIAEVLFADWELPNLEEKKPDQLTAPAVEFKDVRKIGLQGNIEKKRTLLESMKRNAMTGKRATGPIRPEDLRYKTWEEVDKPQSQAVVIAMMDTSGSPRNTK